MLHKGLHPRDDIDRLYVSRKEGEMGLNRIDDLADAIIERLKEYTKKKSKERLITAAINSNINRIKNKLGNKQKI